MPSRKELKATIALYDRALELLQAPNIGFDVDNYVHDDYDDGGRTYCYIGLIRKAANVTPEPENYTRGPAHLGDGPELVLALKGLDEVAKKTKNGKKAAKLGPYLEEDWHRMEDLERYPGRFVENLGLWLDNQKIDGKRMSKQEQHAYAIKLIKRALAKLHDELEAK